jgi:glucose-1-phosphatase
MDYKNIIFDLGDVILDIDSTKSELSFEKVGISNFKSYFTPQKQISLFEELELGNIEDKEFYDRFRALTQSNLNDLQIRNSWNQVLLHFNIERMDFLKELSKRYNIYLFSNTNSIHVECLEKRCLEEMGLPLSSYFDDVWYSNILHLRKPNVEAFEKVLALGNLERTDTLFIDDNELNIKGAELAGLDVIHLKNHQLFWI